MITNKKLGKYLNEVSFSGSHRPEFDPKEGIGPKRYRGREAAARGLGFFLMTLEIATKNKVDWSYKIKGDTIVINYEDDSSQKEEYFTFTLKSIETIVSGG